MRTLTIVGLVTFVVAALGALDWGLVVFLDHDVLSGAFEGGIAEDTAAVLAGVAAAVALLGALGVLGWGRSLGSGLGPLSVPGWVIIGTAVVGGLAWAPVGLFGTDLFGLLLHGSALDAVHGAFGFAGRVTLGLVPFTVVTAASRRRSGLRRDVESRRRIV